MSFWPGEFFAHLAVIHVWAAKLFSPPTTWTTWEIQALHLRATDIETTGNKASDLLKTKIFWLWASRNGRNLCTHIAGLISLACRCISPHEFLIRNRKVSNPCLWIHTIPRQDTFQQGFPPDCRGSRLHYGFLVTQNKAQRAAQRRVALLSQHYTWGNRGKEWLQGLLSVSSWNQHLLIPAARFTYESILHKKKTLKV